MRLDKIRDVLVTIENRVDVNAIQAGGVHLWPLLRICIWHQLAIERTQKKEAVNRKVKLYQRAVSLALRFISKAQRTINCSLRRDFQASDSEVMFFTRPVYLQKLESNLLFDRIVDPLIEIIKDKKNVSKYYLGAGNKPNNLYFEVNFISPSEFHSPNINYKLDVTDFNQIAAIAGLDAESLLKVFKGSCVNYFRWYKFGKKLFSRAHSLKHIYVTSWYFPDMMGLIAAAKSSGIQTTDLQHGQQGKYQIMYSWWSKIPAKGYNLMPDMFWCWGKQSVNHIMQVNNNTKAHQAFLGGYPWIDFYKKNLQKSWLPIHKRSKKEVLFTLQPASGEHQEPVPDFILDFLSMKANESVLFNFRCHPNFKGCHDYVAARLKNVSNERYRITSSESILYNDFSTATHHLTAFSSCCYEAETFGIPTLLFGADALENYEDEIKNNVFAWMSEDVDDFAQWVFGFTSVNSNSKYIVSSMNLAKDSLCDN